MEGKILSLCNANLESLVLTSSNDSHVVGLKRKENFEEQDHE